MSPLGWRQRVTLVPGVHSTRSIWEPAGTLPSGDTLMTVRWLKT